MKILNTTAFAFAVATTFVVSQFVGAPARAAEDLTRYCGNFEIAAGPLTGIYTGQWRRESDGFQLNHTLVVTEVTEDGKATVLYAYGTAPTFRIHRPDCFRVEAKLENGVLTVPLPRGATAFYKVGENGSFSATYRSPNGETPGDLSLVTPGPYMSTGAVQKALTELGYDPGPVDGAMGSRTRSAIRAFQTALGLPVDGEVSVELRAALQQARQTMNEKGITPADMAVFSTCESYRLGDGEFVGLYVGKFDDNWGSQNIGLVVSGQTGNTAKVLWAWANGTGEYPRSKGCRGYDAEITTNSMTQNRMIVFELGNERRVEVTFSSSTDRMSVNFHNTANGGLSQGYVVPID
jgi:peptidoglycan hydrolase-like protein with peptidoglycan-binding domain